MTAPATPAGTAAEGRKPTARELPVLESVDVNSYPRERYTGFANIVHDVCHAAPSAPPAGEVVHAR